MCTKLLNRYRIVHIKLSAKQMLLELAIHIRETALPRLELSDSIDDAGSPLLGQNLAEPLTMMLGHVHPVHFPLTYMWLRERFDWSQFAHLQPSNCSTAVATPLNRERCRTQILHAQQLELSSEIASS